MKQIVKLFVVVLLLTLTVHNPTDDWLWRFEFLVQGSVFEPFSQQWLMILYNFLFSVGLFILFFSMICKRVSEIFHIRSYVITRGGEGMFKKVVIEKVFVEIGKILGVKLSIYLLFFAIMQDVRVFIFYDLISTFLTLGMFALVFVLLKMCGFSHKMSLFLLISINFIAQFSSFNTPVMSIIVIASIHWQDAPVVFLGSKLLILLSLLGLMFFKSYINHMLEVKNHD